MAAIIGGTTAVRVRVMVPSIDHLRFLSFLSSFCFSSDGSQLRMEVYDLRHSMTALLGISIRAGSDQTGTIHVLPSQKLGCQKKCHPVIVGWIQTILD
jgi:hypothetical protein